jgi:hypothetical protein
MERTPWQPLLSVVANRCVWQPFSLTTGLKKLEHLALFPGLRIVDFLFTYCLPPFVLLYLLQHRRDTNRKMLCGTEERVEIDLCSYHSFRLNYSKYWEWCFRLSCHTESFWGIISYKAWNPPKDMVKWLTHLLCIREIPCSNIGSETSRPEKFRGFSQSLQSNAGIYLKVRPRPLPSKCFQIIHSLITILFNASLYSLRY